MTQKPALSQESMENNESLITSVDSWQHAQQVLEILSGLTYRTGQLTSYLQQIAFGVSSLLMLDWSVVTLCHEGEERVMASSLPVVGENDVYSLHGSLTETVFTTGLTLAVEDVNSTPDVGQGPEGYRSYLGIPMITSTGRVLGTICSFSVSPREYTPSEVRTVELFAERAATAIETHQLVQQLHHLNENLEVEVTNRTEELRLTQSKLIEKERMAAMGEFAAMIVHELRNPVTTILMALTAIQPALKDERNQRRIALALEETERLQTLIKEILLYSKPQILTTTQLELNAWLDSLMEQLQDMPEGADRQLVLVPTMEPAMILGDRDKLKQVMINLVRNAFEAIAPGEIVTCSVQIETTLATTMLAETNQSVIIQIHNGGDPIPPELLPLLCQPFPSSKMGGTGFGLAVVGQIVKAHEGIFEITSTPESGTTAIIRFPRVS